MKIETSKRVWVDQAITSVRSVPGDIAATAAVILLVDLVFFVPWIGEVSILGARLQALIGIPALLLVPGYVLVAILFPCEGSPGDSVRGTSSWIRDGTGEIDLFERAALSFGMSIAFVPIFALFLGMGWGFAHERVVTSFSLVLLVGVVVAGVQRLRVPEAERYSVPVRAWSRDLRRAVSRPQSRTRRAAYVALVVSVLVAIGAMGYAIATPYQGGDSAMFFLATQNETGSLVASGYPTDFAPDEARSLVVGVSNDGERDRTFVVVIAVERVEPGPDGVTVTESSELRRLRGTVAPGETWTSRHTVAPDLTGEDLHLHYYLYRGDSAPEDVDPSSAYRDVFIWIDVGGS